MGNGNMGLIRPIGQIGRKRHIGHMGPIGHMGIGHRTIETMGVVCDGVGLWKW
jgi:hypothetical protein